MDKAIMQLRIRFHLLARGMNLRELLLLTDENGNPRSEESKKEYEKSDLFPNDYNKFSRYMTSMKLRGYQDLCKRLGIEEEISLPERRFLSDEVQRTFEYYATPITYKKRRPPKEDLEQQIKLAKIWSENLNRRIQEYENQIKSRNEIEKEMFFRHANNLPDNVFILWKHFKVFFFKEYDDFGFFLEFCRDINDIGKQIVFEIIQEHLEEPDFDYQDEHIKLYEEMRDFCLSSEQFSKNEILEEMWQEFLNQDDTDDIFLLDLKNIANLILECTKFDWDCLIAFYRLEILGADLQRDGMNLVTSLEYFLGLIRVLPSTRK